MTIDERITIRIADDHDKHIVCKTLINLDYMTKELDVQWVVAYIDGEAVGVMLFKVELIYERVSIVSICAIHVDKAHRRNGVATAMIRRMVCVTSGGCLYAQMLVGHKTPELERFLKTCGFVNTRSSQVAKLYRLFYLRPLQLGTRQTMFSLN